MHEKINIISLGCSKNLVDTENLMGMLEANNLSVVYNANDFIAKTVVINTCGFIESAKTESVDVILQFAKAKTKGNIKKLFVMGCLSERYREQLRQEIPEVDHFFGKFDWKKIINLITNRADINPLLQRKLTTPEHYAYVKISEGCNRKCSFCAIPIMTGKHISRPIEVISEEVKRLVDNGTKEFLLIAQELTYYGWDIYKKKSIAKLIQNLASINGVEWIKLHYSYPTKFPMDLLDVMRENTNVCNYLDMALQHSSDKMLKLMRRNISRQQMVDLIFKIRELVPGIALRTTMLVGYPEETEEDFEDLKSFVREMKFERLGVFSYSNEEHTFAHTNHNDNVPTLVKQQREEEIMKIQRDISLNLNHKKIGETLRVIIDGKEPDYFIGRTEFDTPDVDPEVLIKTNQDLTIGEFYNIKITDVEDYDIWGEPVGFFSRK